MFRLFCRLRNGKANNQAFRRIVPLASKCKCALPFLQSVLFHRFPKAPISTRASRSHMQRPRAHETSISNCKEFLLCDSLFCLTASIRDLLTLPFPFLPFLEHHFLGMIRVMLTSGAGSEPYLCLLFAALRILTHSSDYCRFLESEFGIVPHLLSLIKAGCSIPDLTSTLVNLSAEVTSTLHRKRHFWPYPIHLICQSSDLSAFSSTSLATAAYRESSRVSVAR
jgi:hypothetical protein